MAISLSKGQKVSLEKASPGIEAAFVGLGWDIKATDTGVDFDLDASVFLVGENEKLVSEKHLVFYNNKKSPDQSVEYMGDNKTGAGEGDDEVIIIDLRKIAPEVQKLVFTVTIYEAEKRKQNFGQVSNAYVRLVNVKTKEEVIRYDLDEDYSIETAMIITEVYRKDNDWRVNAVGAGYEGGLQSLLDRYS